MREVSRTDLALVVPTPAEDLTRTACGSAPSHTGVVCTGGRTEIPQGSRRNRGLVFARGHTGFGDGFWRASVLTPSSLRPPREAAPAVAAYGKQ